MVVAGTSSKCTGYGSSPSRLAVSQMRSVACSRVRRSSEVMHSSPMSLAAPASTYGLRRRGEEGPQRGVDVLLAADRHTDEPWLLVRAESPHQRAWRAAPALLDLAIAEGVGLLEDRLDKLDAALVIDVPPVVTVGEMERVHVPLARVVPLGHDVESQLVGGRHLGPPGLAEAKEGVLVHLLRLRVVGDEHDLDLGVLGPEEANHPEVEAARDVLLELAHGARHVAHGNDGRAVLLCDGRFPGLEAQVVVAQPAEAGAAGARVAAHVLQDGAPLVEVGQDPLAANVVEADRLGLELWLALWLEERQAEVLEDQRG